MDRPVGGSDDFVSAALRVTDPEARPPRNPAPFGNCASHYGMDNGWEEGPGYLVRDRDSVYGEVFTRRVRAMGIRDRPTAPRSPWQNGYCERLIGSVRGECLDHMVVFGERHLRHLLNSYQRYYN